MKRFEISDPAHNKAVILEKSATKDPICSDEYPASYWLALACAMLTSPINAEREQGKEIVRRWWKSD